MINPPEIDWDARLRAAVAETLRKREAKAAERREFKARRDAGLVQRYALKAARIRHKEAAVPDPPPCCAEGLCPQHRQSQRVLRSQGPRSRSASASRVIGDSGKARPVRETEERR